MYLYSKSIYRLAKINVTWRDVIYHLFMDIQRHRLPIFWMVNAISPPTTMSSFPIRPPILRTTATATTATTSQTVFYRSIWPTILPTRATATTPRTLFYRPIWPTIQLKYATTRPRTILYRPSDEYNSTEDYIQPIDLTDDTVHDSNNNKNKSTDRFDRR